MAVETTRTSARAWSPDLHSFVPRDVIPDALILQTSIVAGAVEGDAPSVRVPYVSDATAQFIAEGAEIPESDPSLSEVLVFTGKVSQLIRLSREQWSQDGAGDLLSESVRRAVTTRANVAYLAQAAPAAGSSTPPAGLLNIAGVVNGGVIGADLDKLADALAAIEGANGTATHIIASPTAWSYLRRMKTASGAATTLLGAGTADVERRLLGVPVLTSPAVPTDQLLVLDRTSVVSAVGDVKVAVSEHTYFSSDSIALRCTWRFGQNLVRPDRVVKLTTVQPTTV